MSKPENGLNKKKPSKYFELGSRLLRMRKTQKNSDFLKLLAVSLLGVVASFFLQPSSETLFDLPIEGFISDAEAIDYTADQKALVVELTRLGISNKRVLKVLGSIPRHKFTPRKNLRQAYENKSFPIGGGRRLYQPYEMAKMMEIFNPRAGQKVLQIGIGSGYEAAIMSKLFSHVYIVEVVKDTGDKVKAKLASLGYNNITVKIGDPFRGIPDSGPFDAVICVTNPPRLPQRLVEQTKDGGNLTASQGSKILALHKGVDGTLKKSSFKVKKSFKRKKLNASEKTGWKIKYR